MTDQVWRELDGEQLNITSLNVTSFLRLSYSLAENHCSSC